MKRAPVGFLMGLLFVCTGATSQGAAQIPRISIQRLAAPTYPQIAKTARIWGVVKLDIAVGKDGRLESASVVSGHPMLTEAALESVRKTLFVCTDCTAPLTRSALTYRFELGDVIYCSEIDSVGAAQYEKLAPQITYDESTVTVRDRPIGTCDPAAKAIRYRVRSAKCLYLWRCGLNGPPHRDWR